MEEFLQGEASYDFANRVVQLRRRQRHRTTLAHVDELMESFTESIMRQQDVQTQKELGQIPQTAQQRARQLRELAAVRQEILDRPRTK